MSDDRELRISEGSPGGLRTHYASIGDVSASISPDGTVFFDLHEDGQSLNLRGWINRDVEGGSCPHLTPEASDDVWTLTEALRKAQDADPEGQKAKRIESLR